ncbi:MAG: PIN domain-containing protein [Anaerolineales bacterium]|nr:PIN domain-containing protein [Anaerolineales bacterium]NUQ83110.1 type II toxin-antitoxin system VapC family toxin [Anaerolineales bacterium]
MIYVDTSALLALVNGDDPDHERAMQTWQRLIEEEQDLICNNYVLVEGIALIQRRIGLEAVSILHNDIIPFIEVEWMDEELHNAIVKAVIKTNRRQISLVDNASFDTMRRHNVETAFAFDSHFSDQGFEVIP